MPGDANQPGTTVTPAAVTPPAAVPPVVTPPAASTEDLLTGAPASTPAADGKTKTPAAAPGTPPAPADDEVQVKFPDTFKADEVLLKDFKATAKELGLKSEQAQKVADLYVKTEQAKATALEAGAAALRQEWKTAVESDKELGGQKFKENLAAANTAYAKFASEPLKTFLKSLGLNNHPEVIRHFFQLAKRDAEPGVPANGSPAAVSPEEARLRATYPSMFPQG